MNNRIAGLFSGIGGIELGFKQAGFHVVWANEIDRDACKTFRFNFPGEKLIEDDIKNLSKYTLPDIDILVSGFPCQPFSICGKKKGFSDGRGNLFFDIMKIVDLKQPKVIFLENVANLYKHDQGRTFKIICNELLKRRYHIRSMIADACEFGIPQHRTRIYIVAFKNYFKCNNFVFPHESEHKNYIWDVIDITDKVADKYYVEKSSSLYKDLNNFITDSEHLYRFSDYGIQTSDKGLSFTLKANMGTWENRIPYIKDYYGIRCITPQECLALQGFPTDYSFPNITDRSAYKQCGNTVCVPMIKLIAQQIFKLSI